MNIGIFGGSFNPVHRMHEAIAHQLIDRQYLDRLIYVPTGTQYQKDGLIENRHRLAMLELVCNDKITVSDYEMQEQLVYTYQTLDHFQALYPQDKILLVIGMDNLDYFEKWRNYQYILDYYSVLVIRRNGIYSQKVSSRNIRYTDIEENDIASSVIRQMIAQHKEEVVSYLNPLVYDYIQKHRLYQDGIIG